MMDYRLLPGSSGPHIPRWPNGVRLNVLAGLTLVSLAGWSLSRFAFNRSAFRFLNITSRSGQGGPVLWSEGRAGGASSESDTPRPFIPAQGVEAVTVRANPTGPLQILPPGEAVPNAIFIYSDLLRQSDELRKGSTQVEARVYGARLGDNPDRPGSVIAVPTGGPGNHLDGQLWRWPHGVPLDVSDELQDYHPSQPDNGLRRGLVEVVGRSGHTEKAYWYYQLPLPIDASKPILAFDFDGVICDSVDESSISAFKHARTLWPSRFPDPDGYKALLEPMRRVRPIIEVGWENTLLIRLLADGVSPDRILTSWPTPLRAEAMVKFNATDPNALIKGFGATRDQWIAQDFPSWLAPNKPYAGVSELVRAYPMANVFIITTKQKRFTRAILDSWGINVLEENLYALEDGPKPQVLLNLVQAHPNSDGPSHYATQVYPSSPKQRYRDESIYSYIAT
eukprot:g63251.t1